MLDAKCTQKKKTKSQSHFFHEIVLDWEIAAIKKAAIMESIRDFTMISLALATGIRNHELISLSIYCVAPYGDISNELELPATIAKGGRPRSIPFNPDIKEELKTFLTWKKENNEAVLPSSPLFRAKFSKRQLCETDFQRITAKYSISSIGKKVHPHMFRHTFATNLLRKSNLAIVRRVLGHSSIQTTQIYTHPSRGDLVDAINAM